MKLDKRFAPLLNALLMALILPFFMTLVVSIVNVGLGERLVPIWMRTWAIASVVALPLILILGPLIRKVVGKLVA